VHLGHVSGYARGRWKSSKISIFSRENWNNPLTVHYEISVGFSSTCKMNPHQTWRESHSPRLNLWYAFCEQLWAYLTLQIYLAYCVCPCDVHRCASHILYTGKRTHSIPIKTSYFVSIRELFRRFKATKRAWPGLFKCLLKEWTQIGYIKGIRVNV